MNQNSDILSKIGGDAGFRTPSGYFDNLAERIDASLPEKQILPAKRPTRWQRVRPFVYLAAMFAGIWCMMQIFTGLGVKEQNGLNQEIVAGFQVDSNIDDFLMLGSVSEYDILTYQDSVASQMETPAFDE